MCTMAKSCGRFLVIYPDPVNIRKVSSDLADCGRYTEAFCLSALLGTICGIHLSKKIVIWLKLLARGYLKIVGETFNSNWYVPQANIVCVHNRY